MNILQWCVGLCVLGVALMFVLVYGAALLLGHPELALQQAAGAAFGMGLAAPLCCLMGYAAGKAM